MPLGSIVVSRAPGDNLTLLRAIQVSEALMAKVLWHLVALPSSRSSLLSENIYERETVPGLTVLLGPQKRLW